MPLGRKPSAFRKTVSDLKSPAGFGASGGGGAIEVGGVRPRKRKLSEPDDSNAAGVDKKHSGLVKDSTTATRQLPRMGRSLANLASSIKKRGPVAAIIRSDQHQKRRKRPQPASGSDEDNADNDEAENGAGDEADYARDGEDDDGGQQNDSTIFEDIDESDKKKLKKPKQQQQQQQQQQQKQAPTKKERRALKKKQKKNADLVTELLTVWEELRIEATPTGRVAELCDKALRLGRGKLAELAAAHDTGRVLEAMLKRGSEQQRWLVFEELKDQLVPLAKSKYGRFVAQKLLRYGAKEQRAFVFRAIEGRAPDLLKHRFASELVETAYNEFANAAQRAGIIQEFFGPELALFKSSSIVRLKDALATKRPGLVMQYLQQHLLALTQKDLVKHSLVQRLLLEYLEEALPTKAASGVGAVGNGEGNADASAVASLMENLRDNLVPMLHTREGVKVALLVIRHLSHKDLKRALKSMKTFLCTSACNEHGYLFVIGLAECDSLTPEELHKLVLRELFDSLQELIDSQFGRKVLLYLLSPRDPLHFSPQLMSLILPSSSAQNGAADKTVDQLRDRLHRGLALCSGRLLSHVSGRMAGLCQTNGTILFVQDTLRHCPGEKSACYAALADLIRQPFAPCQPPTSQSSSTADESPEQRQHIIECSAGHLMLKRLLTTSPELVLLINDFVTDENIVSWLACNRGCFFLLQLYENCPADCNLRERVANLLLLGRDSVGNGSPTPALQFALKQQYRGAQLLSDRLSASKDGGDCDGGQAQQQPLKKTRRLSKKV